MNFPDYQFECGKVNQETGIYSDVVLIDEASMHPGMNEPEDAVKEKLAMADFVYEFERVIRAIKNGEIEGEYFEL